MRFKSAPATQLLAAVKTKRFCKESYLKVYFDRCIEETMQNPRGAFELFIEAPEYTRRCKAALGERFPDFLTWAFGIAGTGLGLCGSFSLAQQAFDAGSVIGGASDLELAGMACRRALIESRRDNFLEALDLVEKALPVLEGQNPATMRDDLSYAFALVMRGHIRFVALYSGDRSIDADPDHIIHDFEEGLRLAPKPAKRTRGSAISGICVTAATMWLGGYCTARASPITVIGKMTAFRKRLRDEGTPYLSLVDAKTRWILGLAMFKLVGGLSRGAEKHFREGRNVLSEVGTDKDVAAITLDLQWCLLADGRWAAALEECKVLEETMGQEGTILMWANALKNRILPSEVIGNVYSKWRGLPRVAMPVVVEEGDSDPIGF